MSGAHGPGDDEAEQALPVEQQEVLRRAVERLPLDDARIARTVRRALAEDADALARGALGAQARSEQPSPPRSRWPFRLLLAALLLVFASLGAGNFWRWRGQNSDADLTFARRIEVLVEHGSYDAERLRSAIASIGRQFLRLMTDLREHGGVPASIQAELQHHLAAPPRAAVAYEGAFEELCEAFAGGRDASSLTAAELDEILRALRVSVDAVRAVTAARPEIDGYYERFVRYLLEDCAPGGSAPGGSVPGGSAGAGR